MALAAATCAPGCGASSRLTRNAPSLPLCTPWPKKANWTAASLPRRFETCKSIPKKLSLSWFRSCINSMDLKLPPLGEGVDSGSVVSILVKEGDELAKGQGMIELETGKAVAPVPAPSAGKVTKIMVTVGDKISVGQPILSIEGGAAAPGKPAASS